MTAMPGVQPTEKLNDTARWNAVVAHNREADGLFVYAVHSTGVYCRPPCPSRRPRRDRVSFYETTADARPARFRRCPRSQPDAAPAADPARLQNLPAGASRAHLDAPPPAPHLDAPPGAQTH